MPAIFLDCIRAVQLVNIGWSKFVTKNRYVLFSPALSTCYLNGLMPSPCEWDISQHYYELMHPSDVLIIKYWTLPIHHSLHAKASSAVDLLSAAAAECFLEIFLLSSVEIWNLDCSQFSTSLDLYKCTFQNWKVFRISWHVRRHQYFLLVFIMLAVASIYKMKDCWCYNPTAQKYLEFWEASL